MKTWKRKDENCMVESTTASTHGRCRVPPSTRPGIRPYMSLSRDGTCCCPHTGRSDVYSLPHTCRSRKLKHTVMTMMTVSDDEDDDSHDGDNKQSQSQKYVIDPRKAFALQAG